MRLYTEEQVKKMIEKSRETGLTAEFLILTTHPIELPSDEEILRWWQTQKFQKAQGEQEYTMLYEIDLAKILKSFTEHLIQVGNK